jgi:hypothetical protein
MTEKITKQKVEINGVKYHTRSGNGELYTGIEKIVQNVKSKIEDLFFYTKEKTIQIKIEKQEDGNLKYSVSYPGTNSLAIPFEVTSDTISQYRKLGEEYFNFHPEGKGIIIDSTTSVRSFDPFGIKRAIYQRK